MLLIGATVVFGCSALKKIPEDKKLYTGAEVKVKSEKKKDAPDKSFKTNLESLIQPEPNASFFGWRPAVWLYLTVKKPKKEKGFKYWLKYKVGQEPEYFDEGDVTTNKSQLKESAVNHGYFNAEIQHELHAQKKTVNVDYKVMTGSPYVYRNIHYPEPDSPITKYIDSLASTSELQPKRQFDLDKMTEERNRIEEVLKEKGYFYFDDSHLIFEADTTVGNHQVDLFLKFIDDVPEKALQAYKIDDVRIYTNFQEHLDSTSTSNQHKSRGINIIFKEPYLKEHVLLNQVKLLPNKLYTKSRHDITINRLIGLDVFKYVNLGFHEKKDTSALDLDIKLAPYEKKSLRAELQVVSKSDNFVGPKLNTTFRNRNFLGGAETFDITLSAGFETQFYSSNSSSYNSYEFGIEPSLTLPRFLLPLNFRGLGMRFVPQTRIHTAYRYLKRVNYFELNSIELGLGYLWNETIIKRHEIYPVSITYLSLSNTTDAFDQALENNPVLKESYDEQFILGSTYKFTLNTRASSKNKNRTNNYYFQGKLDVSGNLAYLLQYTFSDKDKDNASDQKYEIAGQPYSQYVKTELDFRYFRKLDDQNKLAYRLITGLGYAYGNANTLPYIKQFSIGGSSSIRAFPARTLGPGSYNSDTTSGTIDQTADIKIETNLEYRFLMIGKFWGALFLDAGNIWTLHEDESRPGSQFQYDKFLKDFAVGAGFGIRYDANYFVFRLDVATPFRNPSRETGEKWVFDEMDLKDLSWWKDNLIFNVAIGYPF